MIVTARQLEDLHRANGSNGQLTLPYQARLTPLAADWVKAKKVTLGYSDGEAKAATQSAEHHCKCDAKPAENAGSCGCKHAGFLWWCDGPCGPAKAAIVSHERELTLGALDVPNDARQVIAAVKAIAAKVKRGEAAGGVLMVQNAASAIVFANRCPSLRAILGTCLEAVEQGIQQVAANVLIIEYPHKTLQQMKNMLGRFAKANRTLSEETKRQIQELTTCG